MVISHRPEFADAVRSFHKRQTIRLWKKKIKPGDMLQHWVNLRTGKGEMLLECPCTEVVHLQIGMKRKPNQAWSKGKAIVLIEGVPATPEERVSLTLGDGYSGTNEMINYFRSFYNRIPRKLMEVTLIKW